MSKFHETVALSVGALCEAFNRTPSEATIQAYVWGLDGLEAEQVERATREALQQCRFMPAPAELRELATSGGSALEGRALKAWRIVDTNIGTAFVNLDFDDPVINATIHNLGGTDRFMEEDRSEYYKWLRKDFISTYISLMKSDLSVEECLPLDAYVPYHTMQEIETRVIETGLPVAERHARLLAGRIREGDRADVPRVAFQSPNLSDQSEAT